MKSAQAKTPARARKVFRAPRRSGDVFLEVVELFDGFKVEWRFLDSEDEPGTRRYTIAESEAAALRDAAWHLCMLPLEAGWREVTR